MLRRNILFPLCPLVLALLAVCLLPGTAVADIKVRFLGVIDGDSLRVEYRGDALEVRLIGVDAPEYRQEYSRKAREFSLRFCYKKTLRLEFDKRRRDRYGRTLAYVYADGLMLNEEIIRAGLAIPVRIKPNTHRYPCFKQAEKEARKKRLGFWSKGGLDMTPAQWRKTHPRR
ncbi:thermonuclease family protein [Pseudodesulfovibrio thermohalotolerans]|jgi:micrococcal nuclease|uniref:thermonuclease family protein n=1 Tax=Pseudodesulfovibrio thermohalotolerans TaxID=2880651 RepID=UPI0024410F14|nr:thermonuclease family protein [Pseudodesulfovibrio thermohalotolerans]WFS62388.1 thermonuclease family protein [Pseudodesulfovibrio thermohalotolerans]